MQSPPTLVRGQISRSAEGATGALVLGRYRVLERLGAGGFGVVWRARDEHDGHEVALKRIPLGPGGDPARAAREALAVGRLSHPAIVRLYEARFADDGFYLISELVRGCTLAELLQRRAVDQAQLLGIVDCVARALAHAHERGVIHRDVKPQNILVPERAEHSGARAKLTDFGGAHLAGEDALTRTGDVVGTLAYMAPEQADGHGAGPSVDLYSLALVLYEGLTGSNPVRGNGPADTARRLGRPLPSLAHRRPDLPRRLAGVVDLALNPRPAHRGRLEDLLGALAATPDGPPGQCTGRLQPTRVGERTRPPRRLVPRPSSWAHRAPPPGSPSPGTLAPPRVRVTGAPLGRAPRLAGALAAGLLMTVALGMLLLDPAYAPIGGALGALAVALAPRLGWLAGAAFIVAWLAVSGAPGAGLIVLCAALPVALVLRRPGPAWTAPALAPLAGLAGLAGLFPALAAQSGRWPRRAAVGALGFWWLMLAQPLADRRLWLGPPAGSLPRAAWQHSLSGALQHALEPVLVPGTLAGALLWALAAASLPWIVRGRHAARDIAAAAAWGGVLAVAAVELERGLAPVAGTPWPRGLVVGTLGGALLPVGWRALRGPVATPGRGRGDAEHRLAVDGEAPV